MLATKLLLPPAQLEEDRRLEASERSCSLLLQTLSHFRDMLGPFSRPEPPSAKGTRSHSPACSTDEVEVPSPLRCLTRLMEPGVTGPSGYSKSGSCTNPSGEGGLNPRGGTGLRSKPSATGQGGDPLGKEGLNPKGETKRQGGTSRRSESALLSSAPTPGNESGIAGSTEVAGAALLHMRSLAGGMLGPLGRLKWPAARYT